MAESTRRVGHKVSARWDRIVEYCSVPRELGQIHRHIPDAQLSTLRVDVKDLVEYGRLEKSYEGYGNVGYYVAVSDYQGNGSLDTIVDKNTELWYNILEYEAPPTTALHEAILDIYQETPIDELIKSLVALTKALKILKE